VSNSVIEIWALWVEEHTSVSNSVIELWALWVEEHTSVSNSVIELWALWVEEHTSVSNSVIEIWALWVEEYGLDGKLYHRFMINCKLISVRFCYSIVECQCSYIKY